MLATISSVASARTAAQPAADAAHERDRARVALDPVAVPTRPRSRRRAPPSEPDDARHARGRALRRRERELERRRQRVLAEALRAARCPPRRRSESARAPPACETTRAPCTPSTVSAMRSQLVHLRSARARPRGRPSRCSSSPKRPSSSLHVREQQREGADQDEADRDRDHRDGRGDRASRAGRRASRAHEVAEPDQQAASRAPPARGAILGDAAGFEPHRALAVAARRSRARASRPSPSCRASPRSRSGP